MLKKAFLPHVINGWIGAGANWLLSMADATMDIGIFTDDRATFDNGVADWRAQVPAAIYMAGEPTPCTTRRNADLASWHHVRQVHHDTVVIPEILVQPDQAGQWARR